MEKGRTLHGLKQVAAYTGWSPNTIKKYHEQEGLPLIVLGSEKRPRYKADTGEIDRWMAARSSSAAATAPPSAPDEEALPDRVGGGRSGRRLPVGGVAAGLLAVVLGGALMAWPLIRVLRGPDRAGASIRAAASSSAGQVAQRIRGARGGNSALGSIDGREVLFVVEEGEGFHLEDALEVRAVDLTAQAGADRIFGIERYDWHYFPDHPPVYRVRVWTVDLDEDGWSEVVLAYVHDRNEVAYSLLVETRTGAVRPLLLSYGHQVFLGAVQIDGRADPELLFQVIANGAAWRTGIAAIELEPPVGTGGAIQPVVADPLMLEATHGDPRLQWYALLDSAPCEPKEPCLEVDASRRRLTIGAGMSTVLGFDGFPWRPAGSGADRFRPTERWKAYERYRQVRTAADLGQWSRALPLLAEGRAAATSSGDPALPALFDALGRRVLIGTGLEANIERAEQTAEQLLVDEPELVARVAQEMGIAYQLVGRTRAAGRWYERGLRFATRGGASEPGLHELLEGLVLSALQRDDAEHAATAYANYRRLALRDDFGPLWALVEARADRLIPGVSWEPGYDDSSRYWDLEARLARDGASLDLLERCRALSQLVHRSRWLVEALGAEVLFRLGSEQDARVRMAQALSRVRALAKRDIFGAAHLADVERRAARMGVIESPSVEMSP